VIDGSCRPHAVSTATAGTLLKWHESGIPAAHDTQPYQKLEHLLGTGENELGAPSNAALAARASRSSRVHEAVI
jgi:hypothetical protein